MALYYFIPSSFICPLLFLSLKFFKFPYPLTNKIFCYSITYGPIQEMARASDKCWLNTPTTTTSIQQDSTIRSRRDSFSGSGLSSPALQRSHRDSFSGLPAGLTRNVLLTGTPSGLTKKVSLTDPVREGRITGLRPGPVQPHPHAACPDTRLEIDATPPEAAKLAVLNGPIRSWTSRIWTAGARSPIENPLTGVDLGRPGAIHANGPGIALQRYTGPGSAHLTPDAGVYNVLPLFMN